MAGPPQQPARSGQNQRGGLPPSVSFECSSRYGVLERCS
jgi:hypothetical protein